MKWGAHIPLCSNAVVVGVMRVLCLAWNYFDADGVNVGTQGFRYRDSELIDCISKARGPSGTGNADGELPFIETGADHRLRQFGWQSCAHARHRGGSSCRFC